MRLVPEKLKKGDQVRVIAPSQSLKIISEKNIEQAIKVIESLGLKGVRPTNDVLVRRWVSSYRVIGA